MPYSKKTYRPKRKAAPVKKTYRKSYKKVKKHFQASKGMITFIDKLSMSPFPPKYRTKLSTQLSGRTVLAPASPFTGNTTAIVNMALNDPTNPWSSGNSLYYVNETVQDSGWAFGGSPNVPQFPYDTTGTQISSLSDIQPAGLRALLKNQLGSGAPYTNCRVFSSTCKAKISPVNTVSQLVNAYQVVLLPIQGELVTYFNGNPQIENAQVQPNARQMQVTTTNSKTIKNSISIHKLAGISKQAVEDDQSGNYSLYLNGSPLQLQTWCLMVGGMESVNAAAGQVISFDYEIRVDYYVEFYSSNVSQYFPSY